MKYLKVNCIFGEELTIKNKTIMKTELTIEDILNSELMNGMIEQEDKELAEAGWTYKEVKSLADSIAKK